jgi:hypothetical protein
VSKYLKTTQAESFLWRGGINIAAEAEASVIFRGDSINQINKATFTWYTSDDNHRLPGEQIKQACAGWATYLY